MTNPLVDMPRVLAKLRDNPLERVLATVSFPSVLKIIEPSGAGIAAFQEEVRATYPHLVFEQQSAVRIQMGAEAGEIQTTVENTPVWRFFDTHERVWRVSLTAQAISLETISGYAGREDLVDRLLVLTDALLRTLKPAEISRVGYRYLNIFGSDKLAGLSRFVRPELRAFCDEPFAERLCMSANQTWFKALDGALMIKHGMLEAGMRHEFLDEPVTSRKWYLDLDSWSDDASPFEASLIRTRSEQLTARICAFFDWAVTEEFINEYRADA